MTWRRELEADTKKSSHNCGDSWRDWPKTEMPGEPLFVAYVPDETKGDDDDDDT